VSGVATELRTRHSQPLLRAAAGCWHDARGFAERRALAGYMARRLLRRAGLDVDRGRACAIRLGGLQLRVRPGSGELFLYQEIFRDRVYERHPAFVLRPGWCVLDCGANIGMFSLRAARAGCARIFALEPDPETFACLAINLARNAATAVTAIESAAGRAAGRAVFGRAAVSTLGHLLPSSQSAARVVSGVTVEVTTIAELLDRYEIPSVQLLKLDIEGAEIDALEGARPVLDRIERIVMEYHGFDRLDACQRLLRDYGYARVALAAPSYAYFARGKVC
jgi:FkbM family methyltransferase